jgi:inner membrane protein
MDYFIKFFSTLDPWHWLIIGGALLILEVLTPGGFFFLWMGICAAISAGIAWMYPHLSWEYQVGIFAILSITTVSMWRIFANKRYIKHQENLVNRRAQQYIGQSFILDQAIVNGQGRVKLGDGMWTIKGKDAPKGTIVTIVETDGTYLIVEEEKGLFR